MKIKQLKWHPYSTDGWGKIEEGNYSADIILGSSYYILKNEEFFELWYGDRHVEDPYYNRDELLDTYSFLSIAKKEAQQHLQWLIEGLIENV